MTGASSSASDAGRGSLRLNGAGFRRSCRAPILALALRSALGILALPAVAGAEETPPPPTPGRSLCWRGKPECGSFIITEMGVMRRLDDYPFPGGDDFMVTFDAGWMKNLSTREAVGVTGYAVASDNARLGIRPRYRRWLSRRTSIDISPGILLSGEDSGIDYDPPGFVLGASANLGDLVAVMVDAEYARYRDHGDGLTTSYESRSDVTFRGGAKLGSALGVAGTAALFAFILVLASNGAFD